MPNTRETVLIGFAVLLVLFLLLNRAARGAAWSVLQIVWGRLLVWFAAYVSYIICIVAVASSHAVWTPRLATATAFWFAVVGAPMFFAAVRSGQREGVLARHLVEAVGASATIDFVVNYSSLPLVIELPLQVLVLSAATLLAVAGSVAGGAKLIPALSSLLVIAVVAFGLVSVWAIATDFDQFWSADTARALMMPIWLTAACVPFAYTFAVTMRYEELRRFRVWGKLSPLKWLLVARYLNVRTRQLTLFRSEWMRLLHQAPDFRAARAVLRCFKAANGSDPLAPLIEAHRNLVNAIDTASFSGSSTRSLGAVIPAEVVGITISQPEAWEGILLVTSMQYFTDVSDELAAVRARNRILIGKKLSPIESAKAVNNASGDFYDLAQRFAEVMTAEFAIAFDEDKPPSSALIVDYAYGFALFWSAMLLFEERVRKLPLHPDLDDAREILLEIIEYVSSQVRALLSAAQESLANLLALPSALDLPTFELTLNLDAPEQLMDSLHSELDTQLEAMQP